jgi:2-polyprenyl-6-methoxyphenol hydroxylase-like FAD-dependent oxidoreductase
LVIAADGRTSNVRKMAGITDQRVRISNMVGFVLKNARLPHPGYGHIFVGGPAPALAYQIDDDETRVMFDVPDNPHGIKALEKNPAYLETLPEPFRSDVRRAMETQTALVSANYTVVPETVTRGRLMCAGDAGGCCHPLTATGISISTRDAIRLRTALRETKGDIRSALRRYAALREGPQRTRVALAEALYEAFTARTPEMNLLRFGLLRYWKRSRSGRAASMALLSTHEGRMSVMARQYARVIGYALPELIGWGRENPSALGSRRAAVQGLIRSSMRYGKEAFRGYFDGFYLPHTPAEARRQLRSALRLSVQ